MEVTIGQIFPIPSYRDWELFKIKLNRFRVSFVHPL